MPLKQKLKNADSSFSRHHKFLKLRGQAHKLFSSVVLDRAVKKIILKSIAENHFWDKFLNVSKTKGPKMPKKQVIKFERILTHGPYPQECWWRLTSSNGRIFCHSEMMGKRSALKSVKNIIRAIKDGRFIIVDKDSKDA